MDEDTSNSIEKMINESKHVLLYDLSKNVVSYKNDEKTDDVVATAYSKQNGIYYQKTYSTNEKRENVLLDDIDDFFSNFINEVSNQKNNTGQVKSIDANIDASSKVRTLSATSLTSDFVNVQVFSGDKVEKPHGKIVYITNVYMSQPDTLYSVYIVETSTEYIPGYSLKLHGDSTYQNYISTQARINTSIIQMSVSYYGGQVLLGNDPNVLEYWPKNAVLNRTISTSFGIGAQLGYSHEDGFNGSITGNFGYSQSYDTTDPSMNASTLVLGEKYGWYFVYDTVAARRATLHFSSGEMVEMLNGGNFNCQFAVEHELWYRVDMFLGHTTYIEYYPSFTVNPYY